MSRLDQNPIGNALLRNLGGEDFAKLAPHLTRVTLDKGQCLISAEQPIRHSWFLTEGIASVVITTAQGHQTEVGVVGREGMVDMATIFGVDRSAFQCFIQIAGAGYRMPAEVLSPLINTVAGLRRVLLPYAYNFLTQVSNTALANAAFTIEQRLARWLLICHDRIDGDAVPLTHEFLSLMLNVRRAGVTVALQMLERAALVETSRGVIRIMDRLGLERLTQDCSPSREPLAPAA
jgi:CRP-like cAMP-binding protein